MAKPKLSIGTLYKTNDGRVTQLTADEGDIIQCLTDGEEFPHPMHRELFEDWIVGTTRKMPR